VFLILSPLLLGFYQVSVFNPEVIITEKPREGIRDSWRRGFVESTGCCL